MDLQDSFAQNQEYIDTATQMLTARFLQNITTSETVQILVCDNFNRGISGPPIVHLTVSYLKYVLQQEIKVNYEIV